jgi:hypothetical protein
LLTPALEWTPKRASGSLSPSSPPRSMAKDRGWGWRRSTES